MSEPLRSVSVPIMDFLSQALKGATFTAEVWSFNSYEYSIRAKIGSLELEFEVPYTEMEWPDDEEDYSNLGPVKVVLV